MILKKGDRGEKVRQVQQALRNLGFDIDMDGIFGNGTRSVVEEFQKQHSLQVDGKVGSETLQALGLKLLPDGFLGVGDDHQESSGFDFDFEPEIVVPSAEEALVVARIKEYVGLLKEKHQGLLQVSERGLDQFQTTMIFASANDADPDILGTMLSTAFDFAVGQFISRLGENLDELSTGLAFVKAVFGATTAELERAGRASASLAVGNWIKDQRRAIDVASRGFDQQSLEDAMLQQYRDARDREHFVNDLFNSMEHLREEKLPSVSVLERKLYEQWINAHFRTIGDDTQGCIEFKYEFEDNEFDFVSCTVQASFGDKIETALNLLLNEKLPGFRRPIDLNVRKRGCFFVEGIATGKHWRCGWLDQDNQLLHQPVNPHAQEAMTHLPRLATGQFKR